MSPTKLDISRAGRYLPILIIGTIWVLLCGPMMLGQSVAGFRDSAYLYYPLFEWIDQQWAAGTVPLWNPYCNFGMPVVGDGTSSVFYPGKLVFFIRWLSYPSRYGIYLSVHVLLAAVGTYWLARTLRANSAGATLAACSYGFGGSLLFQLNNVVYLVSGAWLPVALVCVWKLTRTKPAGTGNLSWSIAGGVVCALMILGGDPQMVYHVGLIAVGTMAFEFIRLRRRRTRNRAASLPGARGWLLGATIRLLIMVAVTVVLALVQLVPTYQWASRSERSRVAHAVNLYSVFQRLDQANEGGDRGEAIGDRILRRYPGADPSSGSIKSERMGRQLLGPPDPGSVTDHIYQFSQPPWTMAELFWPNASGHLFPRYQRWTDAFPGAERIWVPSIYMGLITVWLALGGFRLWGRRRKQVWLTWIVLCFGVGSFGWFGAVWLWNELVPPAIESNVLGPQVGGVYWVMVMTLPKYFVFRYPAKLFIVASLGISLLAAIQLRPRTFKISRKAITIYVATSALIGVVVALGIFSEIVGDIPPDALFGPFDLAGCQFQLWVSLIHGLLVLALAAGALRLVQRRTLRIRTAVWLMVLITAVDVGLANRHMRCLVGADELRVLTLRHPSEASGKSAEPKWPVTIYRSRDYQADPDWMDSGSDQRLHEIVCWQRATMYPKHHLASGTRLIGSFSSIWPLEYEHLMLMLQRLELSEAEHHDLWIEAFTDDLAAKHFLQSSIAHVVEDPSALEIPGSVVPTSWIRFFPVGDEVDHGALHQVRLIEFDANRIRVQLDNHQPGVLILNSLDDGNWQVEIRDLVTDEVQVYQPVSDNLNLYQAVDVGSGRWEISFRYRPTPFWWAASISALGWVLLLLVVMICTSRSVST